MIGTKQIRSLIKLIEEKNIIVLEFRTFFVKASP